MRPQLSIHWPTSDAHWSVAPREDSLAAELADGHYSRQTPGADGFIAPGECLVLYHRGLRGPAVWGVVHNVFREVWRWRNGIFRNTSGTLSSTLIVAATKVTYERWRATYGKLPDVPLRTEIDIEATRHRRSRNAPPESATTTRAGRLFAICRGSTDVPRRCSSKRHPRSSRPIVPNELAILIGPWERIT